MEKKTSIWYEHVSRMEENRIPRMAMSYKPTCKKKKEQPRSTWFDGIREAKEKSGIAEEWSLYSPRSMEILENGKRPQTLRTVDR